MPHLIDITPVRTYASKKNAIKAVTDKVPAESNLRYFIMPTDDGRFFPVFLGMEAITAGIHFHFNVVG